MVNIDEQVEQLRREVKTLSAKVRIAGPDLEPESKLGRAALYGTLALVALAALHGAGHWLFG